jgi:hypothetical protein
MQELTGFDDFEAGQCVKMKVKRGNSGAFVAQAVSLNDSADKAVIEDLIQSIAHEKTTLRILDREIALPSDITVKDLLRNTIGLKELKAGDRVKLIGKYSESRQFVPEKIKIKETMGFNVAELQGVIDKVDPEKKILEVLGFPVAVDEKTTFYGY